MNNSSGSFRTAVAVTATCVAVASLLYFGIDRLSQGGGDEAARAASARPLDPSAVRARAEETAEQARESLAQRAAGSISVSTDPATGNLSTIRAAIGGDLQPGTPAGLTPRGKVEAFLAEQGTLLGIDDPARQLRHLGIYKDQYGFSHVRYQQLHDGVPVLGAVLQGHVSPDGRLTAVNGKFIPDIELTTDAVVAAGEAESAAIARVREQQPAAFKSVELSAAAAALVVYRTNLTRAAPGVNHLAYEIEVRDNEHVREFVYIDALTGKVVDQITGIHAVKSRRVHEGSILAPPAWQEGDLRPAPQPAHEDEITATGQSYNLFYNLSGRDSWDAQGATMITVNNDPTIVCPNANWNGTSTNYCSGTSADDVVAHEWTHAYTQETSGLIYSYQSGALNESYSDVFGETVDLINNRETIMGTTPQTGHNGPRSQDDTVCSSFMSNLPTGDDSIRWLMGEDAFAFSPLPPVGDAAIRDMWRPNCSGGDVFVPDPGHGSSDNYHCDSSDAGGVHVNSAINNRAYALLVDGDTVELKDDGTPFENPVTVTGIGLTKAAHIFWRANSVYNVESSSFADNADSLLMACNDLIGVNLTKLVTSAETGTGFMGANHDTLHPTPELSGEMITAADCQQVANAIAAVEMRHDVAQQCGFVAPLDPAPAPMCGGATVQRQFLVDWESGIPAGWTVGQTPLTKSQLTTRPWFLRSGDLPKGRLGAAMYQENRVDLGNCSSDDESGVLFMISPEITVAADGPGFLAFEHYFLTESGFDGGNLMISINGGIFQPIPELAYSVVPGSAFVHNPYNGSLSEIIDQNTNPKRGQEAFHGANPISGDNNWGTSQVDLAAAGVAPGDTVRLRWDFGQDGCNGNDGWYVDRVEVFTCADDAPPPPPPPTPQECELYPADIATPSPILPLLGSTTTATVSGAEGTISDVNIRDLKGSHTYMGDLVFRLASPGGTAITLFDGASCAGEDGIDVEFDDAAAREIGCRDWLTGGSFRPQELLAAFNGEDANGEWTLEVMDNFPLDDGTIDGWAVELCRDLPRPCAGDKATGGGYLKTTNGGKINFGFNAKQKDSGPSGNLELHDKGLGAKIKLPTVSSVGAVQGSCGGIVESARALEFRGTGTYNGEPAEFRVCVEDNGRPEDDDDDDDGDDDDGDDDHRHQAGLPDRFHLECTSGCTYTTATRVADNALDGGNIRVERPCLDSGNPPGGGGGGGGHGGGKGDDDDDAAVLILEPVLLSEGPAGQLQLLQVAAIGNDQEPLPGVNVRLTRVSANGATTTLNAVAGLAGKALFNVPVGTQASEFQAVSGGVASNTVQLQPVTALP
jgi:Zn-dependent metalloprotease/subtilisin-like proprotein convertase family protein